MEKRSIVHAVYAESLVFESNFGGVTVPAIDRDNEAIQPAQSLPRSKATATTSENGRTNDATAAPILH